MYKLTVNENKYNLFQYNPERKEYNLLGKFNHVNEVVGFNNKFLNNLINNSEIFQAIEFMNKVNHNAAEFGVRGLFTVSYWE